MREQPWYRRNSGLKKQFKKHSGHYAYSQDNHIKKDKKNMGVEWMDVIIICFN